MKAEYREVISLLRKGYSIRDVAKLSGKGREYGATSENNYKWVILTSINANKNDKKLKSAFTMLILKRNIGILE